MVFYYSLKERDTFVFVVCSKCINGFKLQGILLLFIFFISLFKIHIPNEMLTKMSRYSQDSADLLIFNQYFANYLFFFYYFFPSFTIFTMTSTFVVCFGMRIDTICSLVEFSVSILEEGCIRYLHTAIYFCSALNQLNCLFWDLQEFRWELTKKLFGSQFFQQVLQIQLSLSNSDFFTTDRRIHNTAVTSMQSEM